MAPKRKRADVMIAPCGCTGRFAGGTLHLVPCWPTCPNYRYALLAAAIRRCPVVVRRPVAR